MFERFTERARSVVVLAQEEAGRFNHNYIGTEHLLLGLLREGEGVAAQALLSLNVTLDEVREQVENIVGYGEEGTGGQAPFTSRSKKVLELALREAMQLGHNYIGTEHLLLGLVKERKGVAAEILGNLGLSPDGVRREVLQILGVIPQMTEDVRRTQFRGRVKALELSARFDSGTGEQSSPQSLLADLDYRYLVKRNGDPSLPGLAHDQLCTGIVRALEAERFESLEQMVEKSGSYILEEFPEVQEVTVGITALRGTGAHSVPGLSVTGTFRR